MPLEDSGSDEEINERGEPTLWSEVEDTINDEEDTLDDVFFSSVLYNEGEPKPIVVEEEFQKGKFVDPLGILRMPPRTFSKTQNIDDEHYDPVGQLAGLHISTNFSELVQGLRRLSRKLSSQENDIKQLVRDNFDRFTRCKDVIDGLYELISENELSESGTGSRKVEQTCKDVLARARRVYDPLLTRKAETDKIRQSLSILSRFSFLFTLPSKIATNIRDGEYDKAVQHYKKAATIFQDQAAISHIPVFLQVFSEVENIVQAFRSTLYSALADPASSFEAQERVIRILVDLARPSDFRLNPEKQDPRDDPGWYYLNMAASRMIMRLSSSSESSSAPSLSLPSSGLSHSPSLSSSSPAIHIHAPPSAPTPPESPSLFASGPAQIQHPHVHTQIMSQGSVYRSVRSACGHVARHLPNLWKMGQYYLEGRFDPRNYGTVDRGKEELQAHPQREDKEKLDTAATVRVYFSDETTSVRVDSRKPCSELVDLCLRRVEGDNSPENYSIFTWVEKRRKKDGVKVIKITELGAMEKINKLHKKWGDKSGLSHRFLFKRKDEKFPKIHDPRTLVEDYTLEMRSSTGSIRKSNKQEGKRKGDADFHLLITNVLSVFSERVESLFFQESGEDDFDADLAATSEELTEEWAFGKMRAQVVDVVTIMGILTRAGMRERYLGPVQNLVLKMCGHYVSRVCGQWAAEVALLYLSVPSSSDPIVLDASAGIPISVSKFPGLDGSGQGPHLPSVFAATTKFYLGQFKGIVSKGHPLMGQIQSAFGEALKCFADTLHHIAFNQEEEDEDAEVPVTNKVHRQLRIVSWIFETRTQVIGNLWSHFNDLFKLSTTHQVEEDVLASPLEVLHYLGNMTASKYIHDRLATFNKILRNGIVLEPSVEWATAPVPISVSEFAMSVLLQFVYISSELSILEHRGGSENFRFGFEKGEKDGLLEGSPQMVITKLMSGLTWGMMEAFRRSLSQLDGGSVSICGVHQLRLDFCFLETILTRYITEKTSGVAEAIHGVLSQMEEDNLQSGAGEDSIEVDFDAIIEDTARRCVVLFASLTGSAEVSSPKLNIGSKFESKAFSKKLNGASAISGGLKLGKDPGRLAALVRNSTEPKGLSDNRGMRELFAAKKEEMREIRTGNTDATRDRERERLRELEREKMKERQRERDQKAKEEKDKKPVGAVGIVKKEEGVAPGRNGLKNSTASLSIGGAVGVGGGGDANSREREREKQREREREKLALRARGK